MKGLFNSRAQFFLQDVDFAFHIISVHLLVLFLSNFGMWKIKTLHIHICDFSSSENGSLFF